MMEVLANGLRMVVGVRYATAAGWVARPLWMAVERLVASKAQRLREAHAVKLQQRLVLLILQLQQLLLMLLLQLL